MPLAEAIASACIVVGYNGLGGRDFCLDSLHSVSYGDWLGFVDSLETAIHSFEKNSSLVTEDLIKYSSHLSSKYNSKSELDSCRDVWFRILNFDRSP